MQISFSTYPSSQAGAAVCGLATLPSSTSTQLNTFHHSRVQTSKFTLKKSFGTHQKKIQCIGKGYEGHGGVEGGEVYRRCVVMASLVSTGFLWSGGSSVAYGKGKTRSPFDERRLLEQNKKIQEANNAPVNFPNFVREAFDVKVIANEDYTTRDSGLIYLDLKVGDGDCPKDGQQVTFHYIGYNESGRRIDSSYSQGSPAKIRLGNKALVPGFEEGISGMRPGGKRRIIIPPELGPPVGPSTFFSAKQYEVFDVELLQIKDCQRRTIAFFSDVVCN